MLKKGKCFIHKKKHIRTEPIISSITGKRIGTNFIYAKDEPIKTKHLDGIEILDVFIKTGVGSIYMVDLKACKIVKSDWVEIIPVSVGDTFTLAGETMIIKSVEMQKNLMSPAKFSSKIGIVAKKLES